MTAISSQAVVAQEAAKPAISLSAPSRVPDRVFRTLTMVAGGLIVLVIAAIAIFLFAQAAPSVVKDQANFLTSSQWQVTDSGLIFGVAGLLYTTVLVSFVAMLLALPVAIGIALMLTQYAGRRLCGAIGFLIDLLAAVPSVVYGLWGSTTLAPAVQPVAHFLQRVLGWCPLFGPGLTSPGTVFSAGIVLAIMILPIITAISRDAFAATPQEHVEAALALGATKWEAIRLAVLPYGRSGVVAASMLGLGRALGETIAVMLILSTTKSTVINWSIFAGGSTLASLIANNAAEFDSQLKTGAYIAAGLVLFVLTFVVNATARLIVLRGRARA